ncbi:Small RNA 2'-O-methyltransferase [Abortiporus biennis]
MSATASEPVIASTPRDSDEELIVTFNPPLSLQRRGWIFEKLRQERISEIVDIGCGEGELITCLCNPPPWLPHKPQSTTPTLSSDPKLVSTTQQRINSFIHPKKIHAVDISSECLELAIQSTGPHSECSSDSDTYESIRWEPLDVTLWEGGFEIFNEEFVNVECIVSTEVIEHLPQQLLPEFAPMLLGVYHPHLLLITTPSYTFNSRFTAPDAPPHARRGYPDPTNRTNRLFRHSDHKFEWTIEEFESYCQEVAEEWGYEVEVSGVGKAVEVDEWGRDHQLGYATQVATFKRKEGEEYSRMRALKIQESGFLKQKLERRKEQKHLVTHHHTNHPKAGHPTTLEAISELIKSTMKDCKESPMSCHDLWFEKTVAIACGGWVETFMESVLADQELCLLESEESRWEDKEVKLIGYSPEDFLSRRFWPEDTPVYNDNYSRRRDQGSDDEGEYEGGDSSGESSTLVLETSSYQGEWNTSGWEKSETTWGEVAEDGWGSGWGGNEKWNESAWA